MSDTFEIALFDSVANPAFERRNVTWAGLISLLTACRRVPVGQKDVGGWAGASFRSGGRRCAADVVSKTLIDFDLDDASPEAISRCKQLIEQSGARCLLVPTHSDQSNCRSLRLVMQPNRLILPAEWPKLRRKLKAAFEIPADDAASDVSRLSFLRSAPFGARVAPAQVQDGPPLDVDAFLQAANDEAPPSLRVQVPPAEHSLLTPALRDRARAYIRKAGGGVSGVDGNNHAFKIAAWLQKDLNLAPDDAWLVMLQDYNPLCEPPWEPEELRKPFDSAGKRGKHERGAALVKHSYVEEYRRTDVGLAEMFRDQHAGRVRYVSTLKRWLAWNGSCWVEDPDMAMRLMIETVRGIYSQAAILEDQAVREDLVKFAIKSENAARLTAALKIAQSFEGIATRLEALDQEPMLLNVANGTVDLRTGSLKAHDPADLITKMAPVPYNPDATCPVFDQFLVRVLPSAELRALIQRAIGYSLTGSVQEQVLFMALGSGANGKTTLAQAFQDMVGTYARPGAPDLLLAKHGESHPAEIAALRGARLVICSEIEEGRHLAEARVKVLTGGDTISTRGMFQDFADVNPTWKIWQLSNTKPQVRSGGHALWRRLVLVPFNEVIPEKERDPRLGEKLRAELSGILAWAVRGCLDWQKHGLPRPAEVSSAVADYAEEQDNVGRFLQECCQRLPDAWTSSDELHATYRGACELAGEFWREKQAFAERLKLSGLLAEKRGGRRGWRGICLVGSHGFGSDLDTRDTVTPVSRFVSHERKS